jgi:hypothetical protein
MGRYVVSITIGEERREGHVGGRPRRSALNLRSLDVLGCSGSEHCPFSEKIWTWGSHRRIIARGCKSGLMNGSVTMLPNKVAPGNIAITQ